MTLPSEQYSVKFRGIGIDAEDFPIPFSFRHKEVVKVETINSAGIATQKTLSTDGITNDYILIQRTTDMGGVVDDNVRTDHGWISWVGVSPTDIVHIYKEETMLQPNDYSDVAGNPSISPEVFESCKTRATETFLRTLSRDDVDPLAYGAKGRRITAADPVRPDDALTLGVLNSMQTTLLQFPASSGAGVAPVSKVLVPTGYGTGVATIGWQDRLTMTTVGIQDDYILTSLDAHPWMAWTEARWLTPPPDNSLDWCVSYDRDSVTEKSMDWREFRVLPEGWLSSDIHGYYLLMDEGVDDDPPTTSSWQKKHTTTGQMGGDPTNPKTANVFLNRMAAADDGTLGLSPKFTVQNVSLTLNTGAADGSTTGQGKQQHPIKFSWNMTNVLKNDSGSLVAPSKIFLQPQTFALTVSPGGLLSDFTAYPVFSFCHDALLTSANDGDLTDNDDLDGTLFCLNRTQREGQITPGNDPDDHDSRELVWSGDKTVILHCLAIYDTGI